MRTFSRFPGPADATVGANYGRQNAPFFLRQMSVRYTIAAGSPPVSCRLAILDGANQLRFVSELTLPIAGGAADVDVLTCFLPNFVEVLQPTVGAAPLSLNAFIPQDLIVMPQDMVQITLPGSVPPGSGGTTFASWTIQADFLDEMEGGDFDEDA